MYRTPLVSVLLLAVGCNDVEIQEAQRVLDSFSYVDCGAIAPGTRQVCTVPLFSRERGKVTVFDIQSVDISYPEGGIGDQPAFIVRDEEWMSADCGEGDCRDLEGYDDESDDDTLALPVTFAPMAVGEYRAELTIWSNDNQTTVEEPLPDDPDRTEPVWKVQLRGLSRPACGRVYPSFLDFGKNLANGAEFKQTATIENCGIVTLEVNAFSVTGDNTQISVSSSTPMYVLPGLTEEMQVTWSVAGVSNGVPSPVSADIGFSSNADDTLNLSTVHVVANDCSSSVLSDWDDDADGWTYCGGDCDDSDPTVNPSMVERAANGGDDDCDGSVDEAANPVGSDDDGDGWSESSGDCDDADASVSPSAVETENQVDDDCNDIVDDGTESFDDDEDGYSEREGDTDDANRLVSLTTTESPDGIDNDCDGVIDEGSSTYDDDQDGWKDIESDVNMNDCDDYDAWVYVGAFEFCDAYDNDCDGLVDEGEDDAADGACAFIPEREEEVVVADPAKGCAAVPGAGMVAALGAIGLVLGRKRQN